MEQVLFVNPKNKEDVKRLTDMLKNGWHVISQEGVAQNVAVWGISRSVTGIHGRSSAFGFNEIKTVQGEVIFSFVLGKNEQTSENE